MRPAQCFAQGSWTIKRCDPARAAKLRRGTARRHRPPVPVPYREPLFRALAERGRIEPHVVYLAAAQPGWDQPASWFAAREGYPSEILSAWQRVRRGRSLITVPRGLARALDRAAADCVVSWEYGPATWRALAWSRRHRKPLVIFSELTPWSDEVLSSGQLRLHRLIAPRAAGLRGEHAGSRTTRRPGRRPGAGGGGASER